MLPDLRAAGLELSFTLIKSVSVFLVIWHRR